MPSINMIAPRRAEKMRLERDIRRLVIVVLAEITVILVMGGWVGTRILTTDNKISDIDEEMRTLQPVVMEIEDYNRKTTALAPKLKLLNEAKDCTMRWYNVLDKLTQSMPESTYLTRVSTTSVRPDDPAVSVNVNGVSATQAKVGETMLRLQTIPEFEKVDLRFTQKSSLGTALDFEIAAAMKGNEPAKGVNQNGSSKS